MKLNLKLKENCASVGESFGVTQERYNEIIDMIAEKTEGRTVEEVLKGLYSLDITLEEHIFCTYKIGALSQVETNLKNCDNDELLEEITKRLDSGELKGQVFEVPTNGKYKN